MKNNYAFICLMAMCLMILSCGGDGASQVPGTMKKGSITLVPMDNSPEFADAKITLRGPSPKSELAGGESTFWYNVSNYDLGNQTSDAPQKNCANSAKGQHIHTILNNQPYSAYYTNKFKKKLADNYYVALSFISRSYHESIKHKNAYVLHDFTMGQKLADGPQADLNAPHMFYSRPKGKYIGKGNIEQIMLDFYLVNTDLSKSGNKVKATINGTEFIIDKWQPFMMKGLPMGTNKVKLELIDQAGAPVEGPFNIVERTFEIHKEEPIG